MVPKIIYISIKISKLYLTEYFSGKGTVELDDKINFSYFA